VDLQELGWGAWIGFIWLRIGTGGGLLWVRESTFGFHKTRGISWLAEDLLASQEGLCSIELVSLANWVLSLKEGGGNWTTVYVYLLLSLLFSWLDSPSGPRPPHCWGSRHTTLGRTPLNEWSAHRRDLHLTKDNTHKGQASIPPAGFEPAIPASERPQINALNRAATEIGSVYLQQRCNSECTMHNCANKPESPMKEVIVTLSDVCNKGLWQITKKITPG
jgi:hypothetical protein